MHEQLAILTAFKAGAPLRQLVGTGPGAGIVDVFPPEDWFEMGGKKPASAEMAIVIEASLVQLAMSEELRHSDPAKAHFGEQVAVGPAAGTAAAAAG